MASYIHKKCKGEVSFWSRKCDRCGKRWGPWTWLIASRDMKRVSVPVSARKASFMRRQATSYAKWLDKFGSTPFAASIAVASALPNWPRWARLLTGVFIFAAAGGAVYGILLAFGRI